MYIIAHLRIGDVAFAPARPRRFHLSQAVYLPSTIVREALAMPSPVRTVVAKPANPTQPLV